MTVPIVVRTRRAAEVCALRAAARIPGTVATVYQARFAGQAGDEETCRQQCKQVLINDWENSVPVRPPRVADLRARWWDRL